IRTRHSTVFEVARPVPIDDTAKDLQPDTHNRSSVAESASAAAPGKRFNFRKVLMAGAAIAVLAGAAWYGWDYWTVGQYLVSTDDAYVKADSTTIAPKVTGYLQQVLVKDNERVTTGQVLARIDDRDFKVALDQAKADVAAAGATIASKQVDLLKAEIVQAYAALARAEAVQHQAELNLGYTTITAPIDGVVGNRTLRVGQYVQAGTQLMSVVPVDGAYVAANYKETQLT